MKSEPIRIIRSKPKRAYNSMPRKLASAKIGPLDLEQRKGEWQIAKESMPAISGIPKTRVSKKPALAVPREVIEAMAHDKETGMTTPALASKYGLAASYIDEALKHHYITSKEGRQTLKGVLLEGAIACGQQAKAKIDELNGMQSVVATGILTQRYIDLDKHMVDTPEEIDMSEIEKAGQLISSLDGTMEGHLIEDQKEASIDLDDEE